MKEHSWQHHSTTPEGWVRDRCSVCRSTRLCVEGSFFPYTHCNPGSVHIEDCDVAVRCNKAYLAEMSEVQRQALLNYELLDEATRGTKNDP